MAYSDSPLRQRTLVIRTSEKSIGRRPAELSMVRETSARPRPVRLAVPAKMTSSIFADRRVRGPWAPRTQATASTMLDLPEPLGPTTTVTPGSNSRVEVSAKDLKPLRVSDFRNTLRSKLVGTRDRKGDPAVAAGQPLTLRKRRSGGTVSRWLPAGRQAIQELGGGLPHLAHGPLESLVGLPGRRGNPAHFANILAGGRLDLGVRSALVRGLVKR